VKRLPVLATILFALALLAGCGGGDEAQNAQDVTFVKDMIPHHEQAVVMSDLALSQAGSPAVKDLATRIKAAQAPEIATMQGWLTSWGENAGGGHDMGSMGSGGMKGGGMKGGGMKGMASDEDLSALRAASGVEFERLFLKDMIAHHEGAVEMAKTEIAKGKDPAAKTLAQQITSSQEKEITEMRQLMATLGA